MKLSLNILCPEWEQGSPTPHPHQPSTHTAGGAQAPRLAGCWGAGERPASILLCPTGPQELRCCVHRRRRFPQRPRLTASDRSPGDPTEGEGGSSNFARVPPSHFTLETAPPSPSEKRKWRHKVESTSPEEAAGRWGGWCQLGVDALKFLHLPSRSSEMTTPQGPFLPLRILPPPHTPPTEPKVGPLQDTVSRCAHLPRAAPPTG